MVRFESTIQIRGINPYVRVDRELAARLRKNWRKPLPVSVRINGAPERPWRINMMPAGDGSFYLYLREVVRRASGTKVGDRVTVQISFDGRYRSGLQDPLPESFRHALDSHPKAAAAWSALIPSRQKEIVRYLNQLKSPAAEARNVHRAIEALAGSEVRFMARKWNGGGS